MLAHEAALANENEPETMVTALQQTCLRVFTNIRDALGQGGASALLGRALARNGSSHPVLYAIVRLDEGGVSVDGLAASVEGNGVSAVTAAIEVLLATLVEFLGRLIGEDMAVRLMDHDPARPENYREDAP